MMIVSELFQRSHRFRLQVIENMNQLFELCLELNPNRKLPKPKTFADRLKQLTIDCLEKWSQEFGDGYEELRSAVKYLKDNRLMDLNERVVQNRVQRQRADEEIRRRENVLKLKVEKCVEEFRQLAEEVVSLSKQINSCFELLMPRVVDTTQDNSVSDEYSDRVRHLNDFSVDILIQPFVEIVDNEDTNPIICNLRELHSELSKILENRLKRLIVVMSKGYNLCESDLKKAIDLKCRIESISQKFIELKIIKPSEELDVNHGTDNTNNDDSDDDFEEVPEKEGLELIIPEHLRHEYGLEPLDHSMPSTSNASSSCGEASQTSSTEPQSETLNGLQCNARLPSGKLCPRRDAQKCPFHGVIVERDSNGDPIAEEDRRREAIRIANELPEWQNPKLLRELKAGTGIDLTLNSSRKRLKKYPKLQDIKKPSDNPRKRLERKIFNKGVRERVEKDLNDIQSRNQTHFEDQWNYSLQN
ncbi:unnamed protein product [Oppiella nova]|uniref:UV-stimulated scaffold protein A C-terminal domain-containing protein n=1 Tax=Oppiella nova TaxID=334625 RepID=A0A7R9QPK7_9ACAR|nr:unnamed protein product [Oppiella nova]CAG2169690.1 unnamed protein product [Oppiella nova]